MTRVARVFRISTILKRLKVSKYTKAQIILMKFVFFLVFWFHLQSCIWWAVILRNKDLLNEYGESDSWLPPLDFLDHR